MLHDFIYDLITATCFDRDYIYLAFIHHFKGLMDQITEKGRFSGTGEYLIPGLKSGLQARVEWRLEHQLDWSGPNQLTLRAGLETVPAGETVEMHLGSFDLSTGMRSEGDWRHA